MSETGAGVVIVGGGHAGGSAAAFLRQYGYEGPITVIGEEPIAPYQRPPLSKAWLKGEADADALALRPDSFYAEKDITLRLATKAVSLQRSAKTVTLESGETVPYEILILATGARARQLNLPGADLEGVLVLRSAADAEVLKLGAGARQAAGGDRRRLYRAGGGGLGPGAGRRGGGDRGAAAHPGALVLRAAVGLLHRLPQGPRRHLRAGRGDRGVRRQAGHVTGVRLDDGRVIPCDDAVVGIGVIPNDELAQDAGLECANGVVVDLDARTADPAIFAIGDVTQRPLPLYERMFRLESVANALEQAKQAASAIAGRPQPPHEVTWNWSDQYDIKLQMAGMPFDTDDILVRGDPAAAKFAVFHLKGDVIRAVEAINAPAEFMAARQLIGSQKAINRAKLADTTVSMKEVAAS